MANAVETVKAGEKAVHVGNDLIGMVIQYFAEVKETINGNNQSLKDETTMIENVNHQIGKSVAQIEALILRLKDMKIISELELYKGL